jgi:Lrp/AsnC family transcriptional regulator, leucine-responsive regulatory protein
MRTRHAPSQPRRRAAASSAARSDTYPDPASPNHAPSSHKGDGLSEAHPEGLETEAVEHEGYVLDVLDRRLLEAVQVDGRASIRRLAAMIGVSPSAVHARLRRLEAHEIITGYGAQVAVGHLGWSLEIFALVQLSRQDAHSEAQFIETARSAREIVEVRKLLGIYDFFLRIVLKDYAHWERLRAGLVTTPVGAIHVLHAAHAVKAFGYIPAR